MDRVLLLGHVDNAEAAFADLLQELVRPDPRTGTIAGGTIGVGRRPSRAVGRAWLGDSIAVGVHGTFSDERECH